MPVEATFCQAHLLHHRADAACVPTLLPDRASSHGKNLFVVPRFVFYRVSHNIRVRKYSITVKTRIDFFSDARRRSSSRRSSKCQPNPLAVLTFESSFPSLKSQYPSKTYVARHFSFGP